MKILAFIKYFASNILIVVGLILVSRGIWYLLDGLDRLIFGVTNNIFLAIGSTILGLLILYLPDKDLKEIQKL
jgi:hypothetical protein